jgi:hypothetical protein
MKMLDLKSKLREWKLIELYADFKTHEGKILSVLNSVAVDFDIANASDLDGVGEESTEGQMEQIEDSILLFKTLKIDKNLDPNGLKGLTILAFNKDTRTFINGMRFSIEGILKLKGTTREEIMESKSIPLVWPEFNPYTPDITFDTLVPSIGKKKIVALNTAAPPYWMTEGSKDVEPGMGPFISKLFNHLFPDKTEHDAILDWVHYAVFKRNGTVLCLAGDRGTGKTTFVEIISALVGEQYSETVSEAILKEKFNSQFINKRLIVFEEVALEDDIAINKVKAWCNNKISVEQKGMDAFTADNFSSMVFLLNDLSQLKINPQERRFSIPVVAEENLLTVLSEKEIDRFKQGLIEKRQDVIDEIAAFGLMLKLRKPINSEYVPIKGGNYKRVTDMALSEWQSHLKEFIIEKGIINKKIPITNIFPMMDGGKSSMKAPSRRDRIENFLRDFRIDNLKIADVVDVSDEEYEELSTGGRARTRRKYGLMPRKEFLQKYGKNKEEENPEDLL